MNRQMARHSRGTWSQPTGWRDVVERVRDLVAPPVPAVVLLTTKRAWQVAHEVARTGGRIDLCFHPFQVQCRHGPL